MAKTEILTKDGLAIYDEKMKDYIKEKINNTVYIDPEEETSDVEGVEDVTSAKFVSYNNTNSNLNSTNVQDAIDELKESIGSGSGETVNIVDNLESTSADSALSANQGRVLKESIDEVNTYLQRKPCKNLLEVTVSSGTVGGVTITVNDDKSITLNGTTTSNSQVSIGGVRYKANVEYIFSGAPSNLPEGASFCTQCYMGQPYPQAVYDTGEGVSFTSVEDITASVTLYTGDVGAVYDNVTFYPMVRLASVEDDTYEPYYQDAMTMVNHLNDNALVHGDVVDNLLSNRPDLPLSANQGRELSNGINALNSLIKNYYLDGGQTTLRMYLRTGGASVLFGHYLGNNGIDGGDIFALSLKRSYDNYGGNVVLTYLDGSACNFPVTPVDNNYIDIGFSSVSIHGYIHFTALYL